MGPKGDTRFCGVLSVVFKTPEMHIPPWYWFRARFQQSSFVPSLRFGSMWSSCSSRLLCRLSSPQNQHDVPHWTTKASQMVCAFSTGRCRYVGSGRVASIMGLGCSSVVRWGSSCGPRTIMMRSGVRLGCTPVYFSVYSPSVTIRRSACLWNCRRTTVHALGAISQAIHLRPVSSAATGT